MYRAIKRTLLYALPLAILSACLTTYLLYSEGNQNEAYIPGTDQLDIPYLTTSFSATFVMVYAAQMTAVLAIYGLIKIPRSTPLARATIAARYRGLAGSRPTVGAALSGQT